MSVQAQSYPNLEHIIIDGGSTDGTLDILRKYNGRIRWISEKDSGQTNAINKGFRLAEGDIIGWLNSDDVYLNRAVSLASNEFATHPEIQVLYGDYIFLDRYGQHVWSKRAIKFDPLILLFDDCYIGQPTIFFKRDIFDRIGYLDEGLHYAMDLEYFLRLAFSNVNFYYLPQYLAGFRLHDNSKTIMKSKGLLLEDVNVRRRYIDNLGLKITDSSNYRFHLIRKYYRIKRRISQFWNQSIIDFPREYRIIRRRSVV